MELRFRDGTSTSKWSFDFKIEVRFHNGASISKWSFSFNIELRFQNRVLISKWSFNFKFKKISADFDSCIYSKFGPRTYTQNGIFCAIFWKDMKSLCFSYIPDFFPKPLKAFKRIYFFVFLGRFSPPLIQNFGLNTPKKIFFLYES